MYESVPQHHCYGLAIFNLNTVQKVANVTAHKNSTARAFLAVNRIPLPVSRLGYFPLSEGRH
jgi:hypothetical protein